MSIRGELKVGHAGRRGRAFLPGLSAMPEVRVVAFCDINPDTLTAIAEQHRIEQRYTDFGEMVQTDLDVIVVATPMNLHVPQSVQALSSGKHVLCEVTA